MKEGTRRRSPKLGERITPCQCCGYPISQRHHLLGYAQFGESGHTRQLCANCHELFHIIDQVVRENSKDRLPDTRSARLIRAVLHAWGKDDPRIVYLCELINLTQHDRQREWDHRLMMFALDTFFGE